MAYVVSARKYRPQLFEDVVGQEHVTSTIKNALLNDKLAHAFLFCGPRGVGKTTCARLLAKVINMPDPKQAIQDGSYAESDIDISLNIVELDAASNNSVENIRTLIEQVRFQPQQGQYKVFIIDEVHMLSQAAFNAFLKTLEEPPPYAIFILATTERHKILPTILSRCQLYDFRRIQISDIIVQLEAIAAKEGIETEHDALYVIAEKADGAMRDALSIFDRIASASASKITLQSVVDNLNILDFDYFFKATERILEEDATGLLLLIDQVLKNGFEGDTFMNGLAQHMRNLMYSKQEPTQKMLQMSDVLKDKYMNQSNAISFGTIMTALNLANQADLDYPKAKDKRLHVEVALLKICFASRKAMPVMQGENIQPTQKKTSPVRPQATDAPKIVERPTIQNPQSITDTASANTPHTTPTKDIIKEEAPIPQVSEPATPIETASIQNAITTPKPTAAPILNTPSISSIEDLLKEAEVEISSNEDAQKEVNIKDVDEVWNNYVSGIDSATTSGILNTVIRKVVDGKILISVPSNIAKEEIQQEAQLYANLRDHFNQNDLEIKIDVDRTQFPDLVEASTTKVVTPKEKYDHLKALNPLVDQLIEKLDLKLDE